MIIRAASISMVRQGFGIRPETCGAATPATVTRLQCLLGGTSCDNCNSTLSRQCTGRYNLDLRLGWFFDSDLMAQDHRPSSRGPGFGFLFVFLQEQGSHGNRSGTGFISMRKPLLTGG